MEDKHLYDEDQELPSPWEWVIIILFSASIMGFGWLVYLLVPDVPRHWDFGQLPDTPAESIYSTDQPDLTRKSQRQILRLPEAQPVNPVPAEDSRAR
jgi:hypothetical protein